MMKTKESPFLVGPKVILRALEASDLRGRYVDWLNDRQTNRHTSRGRFPVTRKAAEEYIARVSRSNHELVMAITARKTGKHLGNISLQKIHWVDRSAEFAILMGERSARGRGYGTEAAHLLVEHGFRELGLNRIYCGTTSENMGMQKLALSLKMRQEGTQRQSVYKDGKFVDVFLYGVLAREYLKT